MPTPAKAKKATAAPQLIQMPPGIDVLLSPKQVMVGLGNISKPALYRMIRSGDFPRPDCRLTPKTPRWSVGLFNNYVAGLIAAGPGDQARGG